VAGVALQIDESLHIAKQIAEGLEYAHGAASSIATSNLPT
jgi:hypothetical protein